MALKIYMMCKKHLYLYIKYIKIYIWYSIIYVKCTYKKRELNKKIWKIDQ